VTPAGIITTVAALMGYSGDGGPATAAQLNSFWGCGSRGGESLHRGYREPPHPEGDACGASSLHGGGHFGISWLQRRRRSSDGGALNCRPHGVAVDAAGNLYIADTSNHRIRKVRLACLPEPSAVFRDAQSGISALRASTGAVWQLGGLFTGEPGVGVDGGGRLVVAARDTYNSLWAGVVDARTGQWSGWSFAGGLIQGRPGVGVVSGTGGSTAWIAVRDSWDSYWLTSYDVGTGQMGPWQYLAGIFTTDPEVAACRDGTVYVVGRDQWGSLWSRRYVPGWGLEEWVWGMGVTAGKPSAVCGRNGVVHIAVRDSWNSLWMARVSGSVWQGWQYGGGVMAGDPEAVAGSNGQVYVALRDAGAGCGTGATARTARAGAVGCSRAGC
jgi:DNA-binding beta-propeller fold protein YncE